MHRNDVIFCVENLKAHQWTIRMISKFSKFAETTCKSIVFIYASNGQLNIFKNIIYNDFR